MTYITVYDKSTLFARHCENAKRSVFTVLAVDCCIMTSYKNKQFKMNTGAVTILMNMELSLPRFYMTSHIWRKKSG